MTDRTQTASEIRSVFGQNLRRLASKSPSVSALCRDLEINRTQFNRYLHGDSFPGPEVLKRICDFFSVDARILLEPLPDEGRATLASSFALADLSPLENRVGGFDHKRLPDGLYSTYFTDVSDTSQILVNIARFHTLPNGVKVMKTSISKRFAKATGGSTSWRARYYPGIGIQHADGFSVAMGSHYTQMLFYCFFSYGCWGDQNLFPGAALATTVPGHHQRQFVPIIMARIRGGCAEAVAARRRCGFLPISEVPELPRDYLMNWKPS